MNNTGDAGGTGGAGVPAWMWDNLAETLEQVWDNPLLGDLLNPDAAQMREDGHTAAVVIDAIAHRLDPGEATLISIDGFTGHQVHQIVHDPRAADNFYERSLDKQDEILHSDIPRDHLFNILRVAHTPDEVDDYYQAWRNGSPDDRQTQEEGLAMSAAVTDEPPPIPGCCPTPNP